MAGSLLLKGGRILTMNAAREVLRGDVLIKDDIIVAAGHVSPEEARNADNVIALPDCDILPGFVQTHVHACQTLFRGQAEDVGLDRWLERIWQLEAAHDANSMYCSATLSACELIKSGTTCVLDMGSVHHEDSIFRAFTDSGMRAVSGKAMMDSGQHVPPGLRESTNESIEASLKLCSEWNGSSRGRIRYAFAPRFLESCSEKLLRSVSEMAGELGVLIHSHASETRQELESCKAEHNMTPLEYMKSLGLAGPNLVLAHCVHLEEDDFRILGETRTRVSHCPSSNLKLSSGIADVGRMVRSNVKVSLGCDGAACNNNLDMVHEMRLASLLQSYVNRDALQWASLFLECATAGGATAVGLADTNGSIEPGRKADVIAIDTSGGHVYCGEPCDPATRIVFSAGASDVRLVIIDGEVLFRDGYFTSLDEEEVVAKSSEELDKLRRRA